MLVLAPFKIDLHSNALQAMHGAEVEGYEQWAIGNGFVPPYANGVVGIARMRWSMGDGTAMWCLNKAGHLDKIGVTCL